MARVHINILLHKFLSIFIFIFLTSAVMVEGQEEGTRGRGGSPADSEMELLHLPGIIERIIPVSGEEWNQVEVYHCTLYPVRKAEGLWCKFQELHWKKTSTGDTDCPLSVKHAKLLRRAIIKRCEVDDAKIECCMMLETWNYFLNFQESNFSMK